MSQEKGIPIQAPTTNGRDTYAREAAIAPRPPLSEENVIRTIMIRQLSHGYIVEVGCQTLAIEGSSKLIALFSEYVNNPIATEVKYRDGKLF